MIKGLKNPAFCVLTHIWFPTIPNLTTEEKKMRGEGPLIVLVALTDQWHHMIASTPFSVTSQQHFE
jgi:hypothetical protein